MSQKDEEIKRLKMEIRRLKEDSNLVYNDVTNEVLKEAILLRELKVKRLELEQNPLAN